MQASAAQGGRVLALAFKSLKGSQWDLSRDDAESSLEFAGFAIMCSPMKKRSVETITQVIDVNVIGIANADYFLILLEFIIT